MVLTHYEVQLRRGGSRSPEESRGAAVQDETTTRLRGRAGTGNERVSIVVFTGVSSPRLNTPPSSSLGKSGPIPTFPVDSRIASHKSLAVPTNQSGLFQWRQRREPH
jgi:hypothetical protein